MEISKNTSQMNKDVDTMSCTGTVKNRNRNIRIVLCMIIACWVWFLYGSASSVGIRPSIGQLRASLNESISCFRGACGSFPMLSGRGVAPVSLMTGLWRFEVEISMRLKSISMADAFNPQTKNLTTPLRTLASGEPSQPTHHANSNNLIALSPLWTKEPLWINPWFLWSDSQNLGKLVSKIGSKGSQNENCHDARRTSTTLAVAKPSVLEHRFPDFPQTEGSWTAPSTRLSEFTIETWCEYQIASPAIIYSSQTLGMPSRLINSLRIVLFGSWLPYFRELNTLPCINNC